MPECEECRNNVTMEELVGVQRRIATAVALSSKKYTIQLNANAVTMLHGLMAVAAEDPEVKAMGPAGDAFIEYVRTCCMEAWRGMGISNKDICLFDTMRWEDSNG